MMRLAILSLIAAVAVPAMASSPDAWKASDARATAACVKASGLDGARVVGRTGFDDRSGQDALLVKGRWRPRHMKGAEGTMLCLYTRASGRTVMAEAAGWSVAR